MSPFLDRAGLERLRAYKYKSSLSGFLDRRIMTPFWNAVVRCVPMTLAPNLITFIGLMHVVLAVVLQVAYTKSFTESAPRWVHVSSALLFFIYQTLDAIDGKQARRTGSASPLGQLFDHGCDAICSVFTGICVSAAVGTGPSLLAFLILAMVIVPFFVANWEEHQTGEMRFGTVGVTEGQLLVMAIFLASGVFGTEFWVLPASSALPSYVTWRALAIVVAGGGGLLQLGQSIDIVLKRQRAVPAAEFAPPGGGAGAWAQLVQFLATVVLGVVWVLSPSGRVLLAQEPVAPMVVIGFLFTYQVSRLIISHVSDVPYAHVFPVVVPLPLIVAHAWSGPELVPEVLVGRVYAAVVLAVYLHYVYSVITEITSFLGIECFRITEEQREKKRRADAEAATQQEALPAAPTTPTPPEAAAGGGGTTRTPEAWGSPPVVVRGSTERASSRKRRSRKAD